jgi:heme-degrading monooxygenase HmoA
MQIEALDPEVPLMAQFQHKDGPITLINTFVIPDGLHDDFLLAWREDALFMKGSRGCIETQMHRGTAGSKLMINVAVWESTEALFAAFSTPEFQAAAAKYPEGIVAYPHVFQKIAVEGVCVA